MWGNSEIDQIEFRPRESVTARDQTMAGFMEKRAAAWRIISPSVAQACRPNFRFKGTWLVMLRTDLCAVISLQSNAPTAA